MDDITANSPLQNIPRSSWFRGPKVIFLILSIVVLVEVAFLILNLKQSATIPLPKAIRPISDGQIVLVSSKTEYKVGDTIPVTVRISTGGHPTDGTDLVLKYDSKILEASASGIQAGKIYQDYPVSSIDTKNGTIQISGIASVESSGFNGTGVFATISFKAISKGEANFSVEAKKGKTTDSNIIETKTGNDILGDPLNLKLLVR